MSRRTLLLAVAVALIAWALRPSPAPALPSDLVEEYERRGWDLYELEADLARDRAEATR
tara:strand:+ start:594 stop:770 length:177 start_codon:yes stop_codon:yes gene_type:complete